jgi:hypothetical protein
MVTLPEDLRTPPLRYLAEFFSEKEMFQKSCRENQNTHCIFNTFFFKIVQFWDNVEKYGTARQTTDNNITRRMRSACRITKAVDTHSEHVILTAFPRQQKLRERSSVLRYTFIDSLVVSSDVTLSSMQVLKAQDHPIYLRAFCAFGHDVSIIRHNGNRLL